MSSEFISGVDIGGTKILVAIGDGHGNIVARKIIPTSAIAGPEAGIKKIVSAIKQVCREASIPSIDILSGIGIAIAGLVDTKKGVLLTSPHLPGWQALPLKEQLEATTGVQTFVVNDANAAALGEQRYGAGKGVENLIYITVSTGIGGGIIINGALYSGKGGLAGEIGHMVIDLNGPCCACGNNGCLESLASGTAVAREISERISRGDITTVKDMATSNNGKVTAEMISIAAEQGDAVAQEVIHQAGIYLGVGLANLVNIFNPELIIIGGGFSKVGSRLLDPALSEMNRRAFSQSTCQVRLVSAKLGDISGAMGAIAYVLQQTKQEQN